MDINIFNNLIANFDKLPKDGAKFPAKTFFDVSRYPHYENVCSNILAFFFDADEQHGMRDLFVKSLLEAADEKNPYITDGIKTDVSREFPTEEGNRIDLVIETDDFAIIIENKIKAPLKNDLPDYYASVKRDDKDKIAIVLSLDKVEEHISPFQNVTYDMFVRKLQANLGGYLSGASAEWLVFLKNFLSTLTNLKGDNNMTVNPEMLSFFIQNRETLSQIEEERKKMLACFTKQVEEAIQYIKEQLPGHEFAVTNSAKDCLSTAYVPVAGGAKKQNLNQCLQVVRCLRGWQIIVSSWESGLSATELCKRLEDSEIPQVEDLSWRNWGGWFPIAVYENSDIPPSAIAPEAVAWFERLALLKI